MKLKVNSFSSRVLDVQKQRTIESIVVLIVFMLILGGLAMAGYRAKLLSLVLLYAGAGLVICLSMFYELYFLIKGLWAKSKNDQ